MTHNDIRNWYKKHYCNFESDIIAQIFYDKRFCELSKKQIETVNHQRKQADDNFRDWFLNLSDDKAKKCFDLIMEEG